MPHLLYVSPRFPCVSTVFEQNEILGLRAATDRLAVLSCRSPGANDLEELHDFARPIEDLTYYPEYRSAGPGLIRALVRRPGALARVLRHTCQGVRNPLAFPKILVALVLALGWYRRFRDLDDVHVHADFGQHTATTAWFLAELMGATFSFKVHAFDIFSTKRGLQDPLRRMKVRNASVIFSVHEYGRRLLAEVAPESEGKTVVNYCSVRPAEFSMTEAPEASSRFVALGRLVPKKGFHVLVEAAAHLAPRYPGLGVDIYGSGPERERLELLIGRLGLEGVVRLRGRYDNGEVPGMLADALALVVPSVVDSTGDMDGVPTVVYEALASGRAVIASSISGIPEIVRHGSTGLLVETGDSAHLAGAMATLLDDPAFAAGLGVSGRRMVELSHDHVRVAADLLGAIDERRGGVAGFLGSPPLALRGP